MEQYKIYLHEWYAKFLATIYNGNWSVASFGNSGVNTNLSSIEAHISKCVNILLDIDYSSNNESEYLVKSINSIMYTYLTDNTALYQLEDILTYTDWIVENRDIIINKIIN